MRFQVPQFITVEDKIFGPLTLKQFIYLAGGAGLSFLIYRFIPLYIAVILIAIVMVFSVALAFYKLNGKPFISIVEAAFKYFSGRKLYIWKKEKNLDIPKRAEFLAKPLEVPRLSGGKLKDLAWSLDISDTLNRPKNGSGA